VRCGIYLSNRRKFNSPRWRSWPRWKVQWPPILPHHISWRRKHWGWSSQGQCGHIGSFNNLSFQLLRTFILRWGKFHARRRRLGSCGKRGEILSTIARVWFVIVSRHPETFVQELVQFLVLVQKNRYEFDKTRWRV